MIAVGLRRTRRRRRCDRRDRRRQAAGAGHRRRRVARGRGRRASWRASCERLLRRYVHPDVWLQPSCGLGSSAPIRRAAKLRAPRRGPSASRATRSRRPCRGVALARPWRRSPCREHGCRGRPLRRESEDAPSGVAMRRRCLGVRGALGQTHRPLVRHFGDALVAQALDRQRDRLERRPRPAPGSASSGSAPASDQSSRAAARTRMTRNATSAPDRARVCRAVSHRPLRAATHMPEKAPRNCVGSPQRRTELEGDRHARDSRFVRPRREPFSAAIRTALAGPAAGGRARCGRCARRAAAGAAAAPRRRRAWLGPSGAAWRLRWCSARCAAGA